MWQKTGSTLLFLASYCVLAQACGQTSIGTEQSIVKVDADLRDPESDKASQPQSVAGAYLTCAEYTKLPAGPTEQYAVGCKVMSSDNKKLHMRVFPAHEWSVTDNDGKAIPAQQSYPPDDPDADAVIAFEKAKAQNCAKVHFTFDKNAEGESISYSIESQKPVTAAQVQLDPWRAKFGGVWHVVPSYKKTAIGDVSVEFAEGTTQALIRAATNLPGYSLLAAPTAAGTVIVRGNLQKGADGTVSNLIMQFENANNVTVAPSSFKNKTLTFTVDQDGNPVLTDGITTWVFRKN